MLPTTAPEIYKLEPATRRQVADAYNQLKEAGVRIEYVPIFENLAPSADALLVRWQDGDFETELFIAADIPRSVALSVLEQTWSLLLAPELAHWIECDGTDGPSLRTVFGRTDGKSSEDRRKG